MTSFEMLVPICAIAFALANVVYFHFEGRKLDRDLKNKGKKHHPAE